MCGIAGIFSYDDSSASPSQDEIITMRDAMAPRGPDGAGVWMSFDRRTALGHRRLAIIDLGDQALQPMRMPERGLTIVFNGEIYNYQSLRAELAAKGARFRTTSDTEVLLHLYAEHGAGMCDHLRGMYAFAIYDEMSASLFLARDPFGIKPLYYSDDGTTFRFASQVKALLTCSAIDKRPEAAGYVGFCLWGSVPEPYTLFRGIRSLEPGSVLRLDAKGQCTTDQFCSIAEIFRSAEEQSLSTGIQPRKCAELHSFLIDSVRHHLVADVPVGIFLSAGIDSQCVTALAREAEQEHLRTMTMGFVEYRGTVRDEVPLAEAFARSCAADHTTRFVTSSDFKSELSRFLKSMDQPSVDGVNTYFVSKVAAELGMKVCLSGTGGDEMFGGYSTFAELPRIRNLVRKIVPFASVGRALRWVSAQWIGRFTSPKYAGLFELGRSLEGAYLLHRGLFMPWELPNILPIEIVRDGWAELTPMTRLSGTTKGLRNPALAIAALEMSCYMRNQLLRDADWAGMAHSVEIRVPFVDIQLLRNLAPLLCGLHPVRKPGVARVCGIESAARPKTGFSIPVQQWFRELAGAETLATRGLRGWAKFLLSQIYGKQLVTASA